MSLPLMGLGMDAALARAAVGAASVEAVSARRGE
jgi:hypothetical protein